MTYEGNLEKRKSIESIIKVKDASRVSADMSFKAKMTQTKEKPSILPTGCEALRRKSYLQRTYFTL